MVKTWTLCLCLLALLLSHTQADIIDLPIEKVEFEREHVRTGGGRNHHWGANASAWWEIEVEQAGEYRLVFQYSTEEKTECLLGVKVDGTPRGQTLLTESPGEEQYVHAMMDSKIPISAGKHRLTIYSVQPEKGWPVHLKDFRLTTGYAGDFGFIQSGLPLDAPETHKAWVHAMVESRKRGVDDTKRLAREMWKAFPLQCDWLLQDNPSHDEWGESEGFDARGDFRRYLEQGSGDKTFETALVRSAADDLGIDLELPASVPDLLLLYTDLCMRRRFKRLAPLREKTQAIVYAMHHNMGSIYLRTEHESSPDGSQLRMVDLSDEAGAIHDAVLYDSNNGIVRDPDVSWDGQRLLYAARPQNSHYGERANFAPENDTYKIYEMNLSSGEIRQLTDNSTYGSDYEPCYLPNGDIMFTSQRCVHEVTCGWGDGNSMYLMNGDGKFARRIGFDQTQTAYPEVLPDGRVVYTRRDYNDRGQTWAHALFTMNIDGTLQTEYYGNQTFEPTSLQHTRPIPGTNKTMSIAGGYHHSQGGKLLIIDPSKGQQDYRGLEFLFWDPEKKITSGDNYGREGDQYAYPFPLDEKHWLVSYHPIGGYLMDKRGRVDRRREDQLMRYKIYFMDIHGNREMLASHPVLSCASPVPVMSREKPPVHSTTVDYTQETGLMYVQDVYFGQGMEGVEQGSIKEIRVNEIHYKPVTIGGAVWSPPKDQVGPGKKYASIGNHSVTPVGVGTASFDAKTILGEVEVHADGSAMFKVPARKPFYLQLIDEKGYTVQTMRSWATLMPNENFSCVGCHEKKHTTPLRSKDLSIAMHQAPQTLQPFHDVSGKPFSYAKMIQPIWDKHCVKCHAPGKKAAKIDLTNTIVVDGTKGRYTNTTLRKYYKSYLTLLKADKWRNWQGAEILETGMPNEWVDYYTRLLTVAQVPAYYAGSANSGLLKMLRKGHKDIKLTRAELDKIAAWMDLNVPFIGEYDEMNIWNEDQKEYYRKKMEIRREMEAIESKNIEEYIEAGQPY
ncbi:MAG: hypothetical protein ACOC54_02690 [Candidatus Sumerlaeota bacterium]